MSSPKTPEENDRGIDHGEIIVLPVRIFLLIVGIAAVCVGRSEANQTLLYAGATFIAVAFLLSCISRKKDK